VTKVDDLEERIAKLEARVTQLETAAPEPTAAPTAVKSQSISEFIRATAPSSDVEKALVIGYFLEHFESASPFTAREIEAGFKRAREQTPVNVNDTINKNIRKGYMMDATSKKDGVKAWQLTNSGDSRVVDLKRRVS
jgi:hypothetical protein